MFTLPTKIQSFFSSLPFWQGDRVLLALSGGIDSVVLADLCIKALGRARVQLAYFNHALRPLEEQVSERMLIESLVVNWQIEIHWGTAKGDLAQQAKKEGRSLEEVARGARYFFLRQVQKKEGIPYLATAHHADDQVETFLMRVSERGSFASLAGIREVGEEGLIRPLLSAFRSEIEEYAHQNKLRFWEDSTNKSLKHLRNGFRHKVIPALMQVRPHVKESLLDWQERLVELKKWLEPLLPQWQKTQEGLSLPIKDFQSLPAFLQKELILKGSDLLFSLGFLSSRPKLTAKFLDSLEKHNCRHKRGILLQGHEICLRADNLSLILKALLVQNQEISYLLVIKPREWYYLPWGCLLLEAECLEDFALASFDRRWDFWCKGRQEGKKFFSQWRKTLSGEICLVVRGFEIIALWDTEKSCLLWKERNLKDDFKILANKGAHIGKE